MSKHTPGPWTNDVMVSLTETHEAGLNIGFLNTVNPQRRAEAQANARLIAAAPELLEALQAITDLYDTDEGCRSTPEYIAARAAIAKATGGEA